MNRVLDRQLRRLGLHPDRLPQDLEGWQSLLAQVTAVYEDADRGRYLLERSMEISSREMQELNRAVEELSDLRVQRSEQHYRHLFTELPVAAWEEDFSGVVARFAEMRRAGITDLARYLDDHPEEISPLASLAVVVDFNPAVFALIGTCPREEMLGPVRAHLLEAEALLSWRGELEAIWEGRGQMSFEFAGQRLDGTRFPAALHWTASRVNDAFDYSRVMVVVIDITDRVAAEDRMRQLVKSKDEFLATVSHELRTPLTSVVGYAELLRDSAVGGPEQQTMVDTIASQAADLSNIVDDLLVGARAELGQLDVEASPFDVLEVVQQIVGHFGGVEFDHPGSDSIVALGDCARVRQILRNLLSNAERYGGQRRRMSVEVCETAIRLAVCDDGPQLADDVAAQMFDRYYRTRNASGRPGSVGIGLTISRELARMMQGDLTYRHDGTWSRFELTLPVGSETVAAA
ncbi:MAG: HAMP domain-containing histidine kinase [Acidimicrobiia bacterium]|nr:HAMP domain-containing histidine kinase [Acidimicrobiia bacterium]